MARRTLRVALIGQGFMGRAHSNAWRQVTRFFDVPFDIDCRVVCARNRDLLADMAARWEWKEISTDWREVVERPDVDAVDICTPNASHSEIALAAAQTGKIVLCEKPLAMSVDEARRMTVAARGVRNMVWFNYRRVPAVSFARQLISEGRIGTAFHYRGRYLQEWGNDPTRPKSWKTDRATAGSGVLGDLLSHAVDLALWLNGAIDSVCALQKTFAAQRDVDDATLALARFANGSVGTLEATRYATGCRNHNIFEVHGSGGMLRFNLEDLNHLEFLDASEPRHLQSPRRLLVTGPDHPYSANFWKPGHAVGYEHTFIAALADFLAALADGAEYHPDFEDGLKVQCVLEAIAQSASSQRWVGINQA